MKKGTRWIDLIDRTNIRETTVDEYIKERELARDCTCHSGSVCGPACRFSHHAGCPDARSSSLRDPLTTEEK